MARSIVSFGMLCARAASIAVRRRGLAFASPPPRRAATVISLMSLVKAFPRLASLAAFLCLIVLHLEWPDIERLRTDGPSSASTTWPPREQPRAGRRDAACQIDSGSLWRRAMRRGWVALLGLGALLVT